MSVHARGFTKLEFAIVGIVFGLLAAILLVRVNAVEAEAERAEVELTVRNMRVGIQLAVGERIIQGEEHRIADLIATNPLDFLATRPPGFKESPDGLAGAWTYDRGSRELRYRPRTAQAFAETATLRWRFVPRIDSNGRVVGAALEALN